MHIDTNSYSYVTVGLQCTNFAILIELNVRSNVKIPTLELNVGSWERRFDPSATELMNWNVVHIFNIKLQSKLNYITINHS